MTDSENQWFDLARERRRTTKQLILNGPEMMSASEIGDTLGMTVDEVERKMEDNALLALPQEDGPHRFPKWQVTERQTVLGGLEAVLRDLSNGWSAYFFLGLPLHEGLRISTSAGRCLWSVHSV